ncbi:unnamed protein product, partial [Phaeothamnion confervicola]
GRQRPDRAGDGGEGKNRSESSVGSSRVGGGGSGGLSGGYEDLPVVTVLTARWMLDKWAMTARFAMVARRLRARAEDAEATMATVRKASATPSGTSTAARRPTAEQCPRVTARGSDQRCSAGGTPAPPMSPTATTSAGTMAATAVAAGASTAVYPAAAADAALCSAKTEAARAKGEAE